MTNQLHTKMSFAEYLAHPGYGSSDLTEFRRGPKAMVPWRRSHRDDDEGTDATRIGEAAHCRVLTPDRYEQTYAEKPVGMTFASKDGKAWRDTVAAGRTILTPAEWSAAHQAADAFAEKRGAWLALQSAKHIEASLEWTCEVTGLLRKGRPDWFDSECIYDLKVSVAAERGINQIERHAFYNGWMHQLASGRAGLRACGFPNVKHGRLVVVASRPPQHLRVWLLQVDEPTLDTLELDNIEACQGIIECETTGKWPNTPEEWTPIDLPAPTDDIGHLNLEGVTEAPNHDDES